MIFILYTGKLFLQINLKWEHEMQVCKTVPWGGGEGSWNKATLDPAGFLGTPGVSEP